MTLKSGVGSVQFYPDKPLLETELNELQSVQNEAREDIIRDSIPSGFTQLGELDYDYMVNNENKVKLKTDSVAYVNGMRIFIPKGTVIDIGKAPEKASREDLLFLEVWKEEVGATGALTEYGGEGQASIPNHILDARVGSETSKRVINRWRIRHVADVDFEINYDGLEYEANTQGQNYPSKAKPQGGNTLPIADNNIEYTLNFFRGAYIPSKNFYIANRNQFEADKGLYVAGNGSDKCKSTFKTLDGYVYAIPMFRLYRKPSCGKSTPFEYSKINPKVDYSKFTKLMGEEKVERVASENIKGRSLVNLVKGTGVHDNFHSNASLSSTAFDSSRNKISATVGTVTDTPKYAMLGMFVQDMSTNIDTTKKYTIIFDSVGTLHPEGVAYTKRDSQQSVFSIKSNKPGQYGRHIVPFTASSTFTTNLQDRHLYFWFTQSHVAPYKTIVLENVMILEGDWTNKEIPEFFTGLKSLGEDDGNLVTVKNGILNDNTYDKNDGNQKLTTFPQVTHVLSENTIIPEIQATVKTTTGANTSLSKLRTKLNTEGTDKIEFTHIKGRTIQNCYPKMTTSSFYDLSGSIENGYIVLQGGETYKNAFIPRTKCLIKPNTNYTMIVNVTENTLTKDLLLASMHPHDVFLMTEAKVPKGKIGTYKLLVTSAEQLDSTMYGLRAFLSANETGKVKFKVMLLEGNHLDTPIDELPFVDGIKSVGETEDSKVILETRGKNLHSIEFESKYRGYTNGFVGDNSNVDGYIAPVKPNTKYFITQQTTDSSYISNICFLDINGNFIYGQPYNNEQLGIMTPPNCFYVSYAVSKQARGVQVEEGEVASPYESPKIYKQEVYLKEPLRSLPNGVCDEIEGNKVIRKVGKIVLDANSTGFSWSSGRFDPNSDQYYRIWGKFTLGKLLPKQLSTASLVSDTFVLIGNDSALQSYLGEGMGHTFYRLASDRQIQFKILTSKLEEVSVSGFVKWLSQNPITVYYELANPVEEYLENVYEKESIRTYQLDAPLRSLPNGVKDEIKDGVLIRRCGEITLNGSDSEDIRLVTSQTFTNSVYFDIYNAYHRKVGSTFLCNNFQAYERIWYEDVEGVNGNDVTLSFRINKSKLSPADAIGFKKWLKANPIKVIYELATPIEIPLTEVKPQTADFSLQRQFTGGNWLGELPNGVRDTIENGKVKRRVDKVVIKGTEDWVDFLDATATTHRTSFKPANAKPTGEAISDTFEFSRGSTEEKVKFYITKNSNISITVLKSDFPTLSSFKTWLSKNPVSVLYELETPRDEDLTSENCKYYPCHDLNTYCGSMYVGEGRNYILSDNKMPSEDSIIVETDFREIEDNAKVGDCKYKKCADGYSTNYKTGYRKNLFNIYEDVYLGLFESTVSKHQGLVLSKDEFLADDLVVDYATRSIKCGNATQNYRGCKLTIKFKPNTSYVMSFKLAGQDVQTNHKGKEIYLNPSADRVSFSFVTDSKGDYNFRIETLRNGYFTLTDIQIEEGTVASAYEPCIPTTKYFENTKENDIEDLRHQVSLTGFNYSEILERSFDSLLRGEL